MKKYLSVFFLAICLMFGVKSYAVEMDIDQALEQKIPTLVLITASWAPASQGAINNFNSLKNIYGNQYNYIVLNIASKQAQAYNKRFAFFPNIPYMMMFKNKAKIQQFVPQSCVLDNACISKKAATFLH